MVRQEAQREYHGHQERFQNQSLLLVWCIRVTFSHLYGSELQRNLHVENDEHKEQAKKERHNRQVDATG